MNQLYWNCKSLGNSKTHNSLRDLCFSHKPDVLCLAELMISFTSLSSYFWSSLNMTLLSVNSRQLPTLWVLIYTHVSGATIVEFDD